MTKTITINLLFFGACREIVSTSEMSINISINSTINDVFIDLKSKYPELAKFGERLLFAVNEDYANKTQVLVNGDKLAIFPPVSGGAEADENADICELTHLEIDSRQLALRIIKPGDGAVVTFDGVTRDNNKGRQVLFLEYEAYQAMAIKKMQEIAKEAHNLWPIDRIVLVHRLGRVSISQTSVAIVVTSAHRKPAFEACHFLIDRLKQIVPIWKREFFTDGAVWVDPELQ
ncbi:MAG: molybdenum cofactor biosynthesis protein MoaE [Blastocatellia bacterium]